MKKLKNVLNGFMGCGIPSLPKKFTMNRGEGTVSTLKAKAELISGRRKGLSLTLPKNKIGGNDVFTRTFS